MSDGKGFERHLKQGKRKVKHKPPICTKLIVLTQPNEKKNETSGVDTNTTLTGGFAAEAVIMLSEIWT